MRSVATLLTRRSRSPTVLSNSGHFVAHVWVAEKCPTTSRRSLIALGSRRGICSQRLSRRAPIGVTVRSMISSRLFAFAVEWLQQFEVAYSEAVEAHIAALFQSRNRCDMACAGVLREVEIVQNGTCGYNGHVHAVYAEAL